MEETAWGAFSLLEAELVDHHRRVRRRPVERSVTRAVQALEKQSTHVFFTGALVLGWQRHKHSPRSGSVEVRLLDVTDHHPCRLLAPLG